MYPSISIFRTYSPKLRVPSLFILWRTMLNFRSFRQISLRMGRVRFGMIKHSFHNTTDIFSQKLGSGENKILRTKELPLGCSSLYNGLFSSKRRYRNEKFSKICAPAFAKAGARCICGYEIWESSKHIRCPYTPEKGAVQPCARTAPFVVGEAPHPFHV